RGTIVPAARPPIWRGGQTDESIPGHREKRPSRHCACRRIGRRSANSRTCHCHRKSHVRQWLLLVRTIRFRQGTGVISATFGIHRGATVNPTCAEAGSGRVLSGGGLFIRTCFKNPVRYKYYRWNFGRDQRSKQIWGKELELIDRFSRSEVVRWAKRSVPTLQVIPVNRNPLQRWCGA